jgi:hypothetical protein
MPHPQWIIPFILSCAVTLGCATHPLERSGSPLTIAVGPVTFEAPVTKSKQIYSFEENPDSDMDRQLLPILINEIEVTAQRLLTEELAKYPGIRVIPFDETRRQLADIISAGKPLTDVQTQALGKQMGADQVITGLIHDYGKVRWQYWVTGWLAHVAVEITIVGLASGWNPAAIGAFLAVDATTDIPLWWGGAEIFGFAFRPVRFHLGASQVRPCPGEIWSHDELMVRVPGKQLEQYPEDQQHLKQLQLQANLQRAVEGAVAEAMEVLEARPCLDNNEAKPLRTFSWASIFDLLLP